MVVGVSREPRAPKPRPRDRPNFRVCSERSRVVDSQLSRKQTRLRPGLTLELSVLQVATVLSQRGQVVWENPQRKPSKLETLVCSQHTLAPLQWGNALLRLSIESSKPPSNFWYISPLGKIVRRLTSCPSAGTLPFQHLSKKHFSVI